MKKTNGWTTKKLIALGSIALLKVLIGILFYVSILFITGSIFSSVIALIIGPFFIVLAALIIQKNYTATFYSIITFSMELPIPAIFPKVYNLILMPAVGITIDILWKPLKNHLKLFSFLAGAVFNLYWAIMTTILFFLVGLPGTKNIPLYLLQPAGIFISSAILAVIGGFCGILAFVVYQKIKNTSVVKRIQR